MERVKCRWKEIQQSARSPTMACWLHLSPTRRSRVSSRKLAVARSVMTISKNWCQQTTAQERFLDFADGDTKTLRGGRVVHTTRRNRRRATWQVGNGLSTGSAGEPWSRARDDPKKEIGDIQVRFPRSWADVEASQESHRRGRMSAEALSSEAR